MSRIKAIRIEADYEAALARIDALMDAEPGTDYYDRRHAERVRRRAIQTLERQGYRVMLEPAA